MFEHDGILLRPIERRDLVFLRRMHNRQSTIDNLTDTTLVNEIQQEGWFESVCKSQSTLRLAVCLPSGESTGLGSDLTIGCVRLDHYDPRNRSIMVGGDIDEPFRGKGYGSKMFGACLKYVFDVMNCHRAYLLVAAYNSVAIGLYKKFGFVEEGRQVDALFRDGHYHDYIAMYLLEEEYRK